MSPLLSNAENIPPELGRLSNLRILNLAGNYISGKFRLMFANPPLPSLRRRGRLLYLVSPLSFGLMVA